MDLTPNPEQKMLCDAAQKYLRAEYGFDARNKLIGVMAIEMPIGPINLMLAGLVLASIPMVVAFLIFQRQILAGLTAGSLKG